MKIVYHIGPERIWIGPVNDPMEFQAGVPREVSDELGERLLQKKSIVFKKIQESEVSSQ